MRHVFLFCFAMVVSCVLCGAASAKVIDCPAGTETTVTGTVTEVIPPNTFPEVQHWRIWVGSDDGQCNLYSIDWTKQPPPAACVAGSKFKATGRMEDDGEGYFFTDPKEISCD